MQTKHSVDKESGVPTRVAIQGEMGSNSHMAVLRVFAGKPINVVPCPTSAGVFRHLAELSVDFAVLPIENSLHGAVFDHYDLLLESEASVVGEAQLRVRHNVMGLPGVRLEDVRRVLSHPVALSQCRRWLKEHPEVEVVPFYDTAGSVKHVVERGLLDAAGIAPLLSAKEYGAEVMVEGVEDHPENYTRFYVLTGGTAHQAAVVDKASLALRIEHRPGSLIEALEVFRDCGLNLTKIESRPVPGKLWEYVFFVDVRFVEEAHWDEALRALRERCRMVREFGRYKSAD